VQLLSIKDKLFPVHAMKAYKGEEYSSTDSKRQQSIEEGE